MTTRFLRGVSAIAVTLALAAPAYAQTTSAATPPAGTPVPAGAPTTPGGNPAATTSPAKAAGNGLVTGETAPVAQGGKMASRVDKRITQLHRQLHITAAQQKPWDAFTDVMRSNAEAMDQLWQQQMTNAGSMTAPQSMQAYATLAQAHSEQVQKLVPAFQTLYDTLSPEQKQVADRAFSPRERPAVRRARGHGHATPKDDAAAPSKD